MCDIKLFTRQIIFFFFLDIIALIRNRSVKSIFVNILVLNTCNQSFIILSVSDFMFSCLNLLLFFFFW